MVRSSSQSSSPTLDLPQPPSNYFKEHLQDVVKIPKETLEQIFAQDQVRETFAGTSYISVSNFAMGLRLHHNARNVPVDDTAAKGYIRSMWMNIFKRHLGEAESVAKGRYQRWTKAIQKQHASRYTLVRSSLGQGSPSNFVQESTLIEMYGINWYCTFELVSVFLCIRIKVLQECTHINLCCMNTQKWQNEE